MPSFKKKEDAAVEAGDVVTCRVTARGAGKISTGHHDGTHGEEFYDEGDTFTAPLEVAKAYSDHTGDNPRMYVEIIADDEAAEAKAADKAAKAAAKAAAAPKS